MGGKKKEKDLVILFSFSPSYSPSYLLSCLGTEIEETMSSRQSNSLFIQDQLYFWFSWKNKDPACSSYPLQQFVNYKFYIGTPKSDCFFIVFLTCKAGWKSLENRSSHKSIWTSGQDRVSWISIPDSISVILCWSQLEPVHAEAAARQTISSTEQLPASVELWSSA